MPGIALNIEHLGMPGRFYTPGRMEWRSLREHYLATWNRLGLKQVQIAKLGKVGQSRISRIKTDPHYIPTVDVFSRAVEGLGLKLSQFLLQIEEPAGQSETVGPIVQQVLQAKGSPQPRSSLAEDDLDDYSLPARAALARTFTNLAFICSNAASTLASEQTPSTRTEESARRARDRKHRR